MVYCDDLLDTSRRLILRRTGQKGKLQRAKIARSISTTYYAVFHFLSIEASRSIIGTHNDLRQRRRILARVFTHKGVRTAFEKCKGSSVERSISDFARTTGNPGGVVVAPTFIRNMAGAFVDAQAKRQDADYDLNVSFSEADARLIRLRVKRAIVEWRKARSPSDKEFKRVFYVLMLLNGQLRKDT